eukprot:1330-Rhodomonas_salina.2
MPRADADAGTIVENECRSSSLESEPLPVNVTLCTPCSSATVTLLCTYGHPGTTHVILAGWITWHTPTALTAAAPSLTPVNASPYEVDESLSKPAPEMVSSEPPTASDVEGRRGELARGALRKDVEEGRALSVDLAPRGCGALELGGRGDGGRRRHGDVERARERKETAPTTASNPKPVTVTLVPPAAPAALGDTETHPSVNVMVGCVGFAKYSDSTPFRVTLSTASPAADPHAGVVHASIVRLIAVAGALSVYVLVFEISRVNTQRYTDAELTSQFVPEMRKVLPPCAGAVVIEAVLQDPKHAALELRRGKRRVCVRKAEVGRGYDLARLHVRVGARVAITRDRLVRVVHNASKARGWRVGGAGLDPARETSPVLLNQHRFCVVEHHKRIRQACISPQRSVPHPERRQQEDGQCRASVDTQRRRERDHRGVASGRAARRREGEVHSSKLCPSIQARLEPSDPPAAFVHIPAFSLPRHRFHRDLDGVDADRKLCVELDHHACAAVLGLWDQ